MSGNAQVAPYMGVSTKPTNRYAALVGSIGNVFEWYDFTVYAFLAATMGRIFFPADNPTSSLLAGLAVYGVGFFGRPLGAVIFGRLGDIWGRKSVMVISLLLMAVASLVMGVTPSYASVGILGPVLIVVARLAQGVSAGAEFGSATAFLTEWSPEGRRGLFASFQQLGTNCGLLIALAVVAGISNALTPDEFQQWGWRLPFLLGSGIALIGIYMRRNVEETPVFEKVAAGVAPVVTSPVLRPLLQGVGIGALWSACSHGVIVYFQYFIQSFAHLTRGQALSSTMIAVAVSGFMIPVWASLSDRIGRRPLLIGGSLALLLLTYPLYRLVLSGAGLGGIIITHAALAARTAVMAGVCPVAISELYESRSRSTWVSVAGAIAVTVFGGFAPFISEQLIHWTGSPISPAFYIMATAVISLVAAVSMRETAHQQLR